MGWNSEGIDLTQEPRKVFVNFLIFNIKEIEADIFFKGRCTAAIQPLRGLIDSLDEKSQEALKPYHDKLVACETDLQSLTMEEVETIYREVMAYLHKTYLKEVRFAKPKYPTGKLGVPDV